MREITRLLINDFGIKKVGYDFMGYEFNNIKQLSFHHLIIPKRLCKEQGYGDGYLYWNGAILRQNTSHDYLHLIEVKDRDVFEYITKMLIDENIKSNLVYEDIKKINGALESFEREHSEDGDIKLQYTRRLVKKRY